MAVTRAKWRAKRSLDRLGVTLIRVAIIAHNALRHQAPSRATEGAERARGANSLTMG